MNDSKYQPVERLGKGGGGEVWLARVTGINELIAIKFMTVPDDPERESKVRERFARERDIALHVEHPHILRAVDSGNEFRYGHTVPFLVYPYIPNGSLQDFTEKSPPWRDWTLVQIADVITQAAQALHYLHTLDPLVVHRDVKPGNFLVRVERKPERFVHLWLSDFGIARLQHVTSDMTMNPIGTRGYMAPELLQGRVKTACDQYSLAVMAYYLLTGILPQVDIESDQIIGPTRINPTKVLYTEIDGVITAALSLNPAERFPTIIDFASALQDAILHLHRLYAPFSYSAPTEKLDEDFQTIPSSHQTRTVPGLQHPSLDLILPSIPLDVVGNESLVVDEPLPLAVPGIVSQPDKPPAINLRAVSLHTLLKKELPARPCMIRWSPDGNSILCTFYGHSPLLIERDGKIKTEVLQIEGSAPVACWSPDGQILAVSVQSKGQFKDSNKIHFWDRATQQESLSPQEFNTPLAIDGLDWSVKGRLAVWVDNQILLYALPKHLSSLVQFPVAQSLSIQQIHCGSIDALHWSPNGSLLAAGGNKGEVCCLYADTGIVQWSPSSRSQRVTSLAWAPDSSLLAVAFKNGRVIGWDAHKREEVLLWKKLPVHPRMLNVSAQHAVAVASDEQDVLVGFPGEDTPSAMVSGQGLIAWSPVRSELATLDAQRDTMLVIYQQ